MTRADRQLPAPSVRFEPDFLARAANLEARLSATRQRREGQGQAQLSGAGADLVGFRPYRPGEDLRQLDWNLLARLEKPFVRVTRREAGESWVVAIDASGSMGVGPPGKLQRAAECAAALSSVGARLGAKVRIVMSAGSSEAPRIFEDRAREGPGALLSFLQSYPAEGSSGMASLLAGPGFVRDAGRIFLIGDLDETPASRVLSLRRASREVSLLQLCAPEEFEPELGAVEWWDPEAGELLRLDVSDADRSRYHKALEARLELWREMASRHRITYACRSTREEFEVLVSEMLNS